MSAFKKSVLLFISIIILFSGGVLFNQFRGNVPLGTDLGVSLKESVLNCLQSPQIERFSCYQRAIDNHYNNNLESYVSSIEFQVDEFFVDDVSNYGTFGTSCHTFYHAVGDFISRQVPLEDFDQAVDLCSNNCTGGCLMGLYMRKGLQESYSTESLLSLKNYCIQDQETLCSHTLGHVYNDAYTGSNLKLIDEISKEKYEFELEDYSYDVTEHPSLSKAYGACRGLEDESLIYHCNIGVSHNLFLFLDFSEVGYGESAKSCSDLEEEVDQIRCSSGLAFRVGRNSVTRKFLDGDFQEGNSECSSVTKSVGREGVLENCYVGLGDGIGGTLISKYPDISLLDKDRKEDYIQQLSENISLCNNAASGYVNACFNGLLHGRTLDDYLKYDISNSAADYYLKTK